MDTINQFPGTNSRMYDEASGGFHQLCSLIPQYLAVLVGITSQLLK